MIVLPWWWSLRHHYGNSRLCTCAAAGKLAFGLIGYMRVVTDLYVPVQFALDLGKTSIETKYESAVLPE